MPPILRIKQIRHMSPDEREKRLGELQTELVRLRTMTEAGGSIEDSSRVRHLRRAIARVLTIENQPAPKPAPVKKAKKVEKKKKEETKKPESKKETAKKAKEKKKIKEDKEQ
jgi:large subunit ribosomal protein L29